jgi:dephospho-CoA kinase
MIIGLTGGIGSGKSAAGNEFENLGITVIDADSIAKEASSQNSISYIKIVEHFGNSILDDLKNIDRKKLRDIIFTDFSQKKILEGFLHPVIRENISSAVLASRSNYTIIMVPLIYETKSMNQYDRIIVIDCEEDIQLLRASNRDSSSQEDIQKILQSQATRQERLSIANEVIINNSSFEALREQVFQIHQTYMELTNE